MDEIIKEFLVESYEYLNQLDNDLVELEARSSDPELLNRIFRAVHTIKGTSGFLSYEKLVSITHVGEGLLDRLRKQSLAPNQKITTALLALVDAIRQLLSNIEATREEGDADYTDLVDTLARLQDPDAELAADTVPVPDDTGPELEAKGDAAAPEADERPRQHGRKALARLHTLRVLLELYARARQPISLADLAEACDLAEGTVRNHLTALNKEGQVEMIGDGTYRPANAPAPDAEPEGTAERSTEAAAEAEPARQAPASPAPEAAPATPAEPGAEENEQPRSNVYENTIRVDVRLLDALVNLVGELVLARNQILQSKSAQTDRALAASSQQLNIITAALQEGIMKTRMQPIGNVLNKFPRVVRDLVIACEKEARVELEGADTELDKTIIEAIKDPLTHLVRNAIDHGIEKPDERIARGKPAEGRLLLRAYHEGGQVNIEIIDDGGGIPAQRVRRKAIERGVVTQPDADRMSDREILQLIFTPGFSTAEKVTNISGRGVGMDVVRTNVEKLGGTIDVNSKPGHGTTFKIKVPLTLAIIPALIVRTRGARFAIPQVNLLELVRLEGEQAQNGIETINGAPVHRLRGKLLPLIYLDKELRLSGPDEAAQGRPEDATPGADLDVPVDAVNVVVLQAYDQRFGLVVDEIIDTEEVVVKPLCRQLKHIPAFAGATIMGDGKIALILDVLGLADRAGVLSEEVRARTTLNTQSRQENAEQQSLLLMKAGENRRLAIPLSEVSRLEEIPSDRVEWAGNQELVQYRGQLMPLIRLARVPGINAYQADAAPGLMQVVVCGHHGACVGLVVDEIVDVVEETVALQRGKRQGVVLGVAVIQNRVTELLNMPRIIDAADVDFLGDYKPVEA